MSKIYKLYINGKLKRPGTQQYPYLGPKVAVVAEKLDPIVGQLCSNRKTVRNSDHENEFRGSKNGGREVWVSLEWPENTKIQRPKVAAATAFAGPIRACPAAAGREI